jgi:glycosyltransferase involved in cell wall biosynthesis
VISPAALHYPRAYDTPLGPAEWANAAAKEVLVRRFRRRVDTHAVLTMDPEAAARWRRAAGGPVQALPEPPVRPLPGSRARRDGVVLYGALAPRKGIGLVARALGPAGGGADGLRVVLAGRVAAGYEDAFAAQALELELGGARVERHLGWLPDGVGLELLSCARCVVIAYVGHKGSSRVLTEAAAVGTPVVAHAGGLVGALVREHGLGLAVDARDPGALRAAVLALARDPEAVARHAPALAAFAEGSSPPRFRAAATAPFRGCPQARFRAS